MKHPDPDLDRFYQLECDRKAFESHEKASWVILPLILTASILYYLLT